MLLKRFAKIWIAPVLGFSLIACEDSLEVGSGGDFSTLSPQPSGAAFYDAFTYATNQPYFQAPKNGSTKTLDCPGGGTIVTSLSLSTATSTLPTGTMSATYQDCKITMELNSVSYSETINGSVVSDIRETSDSITRSTEGELTVSGDLGFSLECHLIGETKLQNFAKHNFSGTCVFRDKNGTALEVTSQEAAAGDELIPT